MIILGAETSTLLGSVALLKDGNILAAEESMRQGSHSDILNVFISRVLEKAKLKLSDIDLFVTGVGPGSFTGIRICLNTIKTLSYCHQKPSFGFDSLNSLAYSVSHQQLSGEFQKYPIISMVNAYKNMVYVATYKTENSVLIEQKSPEVIRVQNIENYVSQKSIICGDAFSVYEKYFSQNLKDLLVRDPKFSDEPHAISLVKMAYENVQNQKNPTPWSELLPLYLRASEAEENLKGIKYQPLI